MMECPVCAAAEWHRQVAAASQTPNPTGVILTPPQTSNAPENVTWAEWRQT